jgi:cytochrome c oxidase subunit 2
LFQVALAVQPPTDAIWYGLLDWYLVLGTIAGVVVTTYLVWHVVMNRASRKGFVKKNKDFHPNETAWGDLKTLLPILALTTSALAIVQYQTFSSNGLYVPPHDAAGSDPPLYVGVEGRQWQWLFTYPNGAIVEGNLTVPVNTEVILNITSGDVTHILSIPAFSIAMDAVPGRFTTLWFNGTNTGTYEIRCKEICGVGHAFMIGYVTVVSQSAYQKWYSSLPSNATNFPGGP